MNKHVLSGKVTRLHGEVFVIGCFEDVRPLKGAAGEIDWLFAGLLSHLFVQKKMTGAKGETALLATQGKIPIEKVLLIGLGEKGKYGLSVFEGTVEMVIGLLKQMNSREPILELLGIEECGLPAPKALAFLVKALNGNKEQRELSFYVRSDERARELKQRLRFSPGDIAVG